MVGISNFLKIYFHYLDSKFFNILGTGLSCGDVTFCRSTGQVGCLEIHSVIHDLQNACSQTGA